MRNHCQILSCPEFTTFLLSCKCVPVTIIIVIIYKITYQLLCTFNYLSSGA